MAAFIPLIAVVASGVAGMLSSNAQAEATRSAQEENLAAQYRAEERAVQRQKEQAAANEKAWKENAFPKADVIASKRNELASELGGAKENAYEQLLRKASVLGRGPSSGITREGAQGIEGNYLSSLGKGITDLTKFQNTPQWSLQPNSTLGMVNQPNYSPYQSTGTSPLSTAAGYLAGKYGDTSVPGYEDENVSLSGWGNNNYSSIYG